LSCIAVYANTCNKIHLQVVCKFKRYICCYVINTKSKVDGKRSLSFCFVLLILFYFIADVQIQDTCVMTHSAYVGEAFSNPV